MVRARTSKTGSCLSSLLHRRRATGTEDAALDSRPVCSPPAIPEALLGRAAIVSTAPFVLYSYGSSAYYSPADNDTTWREVHFSGCLVRCVEVKKAAKGFVRSGTGQFAVKVIPKEAMEKSARAQGRKEGNLIGEDPLKELAALALLNANGGHPNIEELVEALENEQYLFKVSKWYECDAFDVAPLPEDEARDVIRQVLSAADFMHLRGIVHRDISLENLLFQKNAEDGSLRARVVDFGLALAVPRDMQGRPLPMPSQGRCGKPSTMSPEIHSGASFHGASADVWSIGAVLYMLLLGVCPWRRCGDELFCVVAVRGELRELLRRWKLHDRISSLALDLLQNMLILDPSRRLSTIEAVLAHPWFGVKAGGGGGGGGDEEDGAGTASCSVASSGHSRSGSSIGSTASVGSSAGCAEGSVAGSLDTESQGDW